MSKQLTSIAAWLALTGFSACVAEVAGDPPSDDTARRVDDDVPLRATLTPDLPDDPQTPEEPDDTPPEGCDATVAETGACSIACNTDAVIDQYVPAGTCVVFECDLVDGGTLQIGGCKM